MSMSMGSSESEASLRRRLADYHVLEEGEVRRGDQSSSDTDDYYNRDAELSAGSESEETVSDDLGATASSSVAKATASTVLADLYATGGAYSVPATRYRPSCPAATHYGRARASSAAASHYGRASAFSAVFPCRVCGKEFSSDKAVCGHMKVHAIEALHGGVSCKGNGIKGKKVMKSKKKSGVEVVAGWGVTRRRGCSGLGTSKDIGKDSAESDHSANALPANAKPQLIAPLSYAMPEKPSSAMPKMDSSSAMPKMDSSSAVMASARTSLSDESSGKKPMTQHNDGMDIAEAAAAGSADNPKNPILPAEPVVVHQQDEQPAPPPAGKKRRNPAARPPAQQQRPEGYTCHDPACGMWFSTHQALGGHAAAHKNRARLAAAAGMHQGQGGAAQAVRHEEKLHRCNKCPALFATGVQLGGHKRKHWEGEPIKPKRRPRLVQPLPPPLAVVTPKPVLHAALTIKEELQSVAPAVDAAQPSPTAAAAEGTPEPAPGPLVTGSVILFGIDIGVKTPPAQEGSPATKDSSSPSTGGESSEQQ